MKIGIGITTTSKRPPHAAHWRRLSALMPKEIEVFFAHDIKGVAAAKNTCLRALQHCDYIYLFDDDCFFLTNDLGGYDISDFERLPEISKETGCHHFSYLVETPTLRKIGKIGELTYYNNSAGCMMFITRKVLEKVGAFNEGFGLYGYEHAEYSERIFRAGLSPHRNVTWDGLSGYIYSMDLQSSMKFSFEHHSTLTAEEMAEAEKIARLELENEMIIYRPLSQ